MKRSYIFLSASLTNTNKTCTAYIYNTIQYTLFNEGEHINLLQFSNICILPLWQTLFSLLSIFLHSHVSLTGKISWSG